MLHAQLEEVHKNTVIIYLYSEVSADIKTSQMYPTFLCSTIME